MMTKSQTSEKTPIYIISNISLHFFNSTFFTNKQMGFFDNIDKGLGKVEKAGFNTANRIHRFAVNCILLFIGYNIYTIFRDYNLHFREKRVILLHNGRVMSLPNLMSTKNQR